MCLCSSSCRRWNENHIEITRKIYFYHEKKERKTSWHTLVKFANLTGAWQQLQHERFNHYQWKKDGSNTTSSKWADGMWAKLKYQSIHQIYFFKTSLVLMYLIPQKKWEECRDWQLSRFHDWVRDCMGGNLIWQLHRSDHYCSDSDSIDLTTARRQRSRWFIFIILQYWEVGSCPFLFMLLVLNHWFKFLVKTGNPCKH